MLYLNEIKHNFMKNLLIILVLIISLNGCIFGQEEQTEEIQTHSEQVEQTEPEQVIELQEQTEETDAKTETETDLEAKKQEVIEQQQEENYLSEDVDLPATFKLDVAFASQAPFADWGMPYQEACEESSLIIADKYFRNQALEKQIMKDEILKVVEWEKQEFGFYESTDTEETLKIAKEYFKLDAYITEDVSVDRIKKELVAGHLIIPPAAGRILDNPNYTGEGPLYHMLVITGYDRNEFITNDVGTRKGEDFKFSYENMLESIHDYNHGDIYNGKPMMIVITGILE